MLTRIVLRVLKVRDKPIAPMRRSARYRLILVVPNE